MRMCLPSRRVQEGPFVFPQPLPVSPRQLLAYCLLNVSFRFCVTEAHVVFFQGCHFLLLPLIIPDYLLLLGSTLPPAATLDVDTSTL